MRNNTQPPKRRRTAHAHLLSRDEMANTLFKILLYFLKHETLNIAWVKNLRDTGRRKYALDGMNRKTGSKYLIFLHERLQTTPMRAAKNLVHETFHCLASIDANDEEEIFVRRLTRYFWKKSTSAQKRKIMQFLPAFNHFARQPR